MTDWGYWGMFISAFLAGTILPFSSEAVLGLLLIAGYDSWGCVFSATLGNWLGGVTCYYIGYLGKTEWIHTYLKIPEEKLSKMQRFLKGKGSVLLGGNRYQLPERVVSQSFLILNPVFIVFQ